MNRRTLLRASAAAVGGGGAALAGVQLASNEADAATALTLDVAGDSTTLGADESVTAVRLALDVDWAYELPTSAAPDTAVVEIAAGTDTLTVVDSAESAQLFTAAEGSESFDVDLLAAGALSAGELAPSSGSRQTDVTIEARFRVEESEGAVIARETASDTAPVTVDRESSPSEYGSVGGDGEVTIETA